MASPKRPNHKPLLKPETKTDKSSDDDIQTIEIDAKKKTVTLKLSGRGVILVYAISFAALILAIGYVAVQLATAWRLVLTPFEPTMGLLLWGSIAFISAYLSR